MPDETDYADREGGQQDRDFACGPEDGNYDNEERNYVNKEGNYDYEDVYFDEHFAKNRGDGIGVEW